MRPFIVGVGRAGTRIANLFLLKGYRGILLDTERSDLVYFPYKYKSLLGEKFVDGNGTGKDLELGRKIMEAETYNIVDRMDQIKDGDMDSIFVFSGMGGLQIAPMAHSVKPYASMTTLDVNDFFMESVGMASVTRFSIFYIHTELRKTELIIKSNRRRKI